MAGKKDTKAQEKDLDSQEQSQSTDTDAWLAQYSAPAQAKRIAKRKSEDGNPFDRRYLLTGIEAIDKALGGGILSPGLTVLGAAPGIGKTTLALQIAQHIARVEPERKVLFFSLEMAMQVLIPKIQSCCSHLAMLSRGAVKVLSEHAEDAEVMAEALENLPENLYIIDDRTPRPSGETAWTAPAICSVVKQVAASAQGAFLRPLIIVDYLQFIPPTKEGVEERIRVNEALNEFSGVTDRAAVLLISSLNRSAYNRPIQEDAFKETGLIEFSADVLLGMQYSALNSAELLKNGAYAINRVQEAAKNPREVELIVLKNRYAGMGAQVPLHFYPREGFFVAAEEDQSAVVSEPFYINIAYAIADRLRSPRSANEAKLEGSRLVFSGIAKRDRLSNGKKLQSPIGVGFRIEQPADAPINGFDMVVADAIYTLYRRGVKSFSPATIQKLMTGGQPSYAQRNKDIANSIEKMRVSTIQIDCTKWAELDSRYFSGRVEQVYGLAETAAFLDLVQVGAQGKPKYEFTGAHPLPLYLYTEWTARFVEAPVGLFDIGSMSARADEGGGDQVKGTKNAFSYTHDNVAILHYLIEQVELIRNPKNRREKPEIVLFRIEDGQPRGAFARAGAATANEAGKLWAKERGSRGSKPVTYIMDRLCAAGYIVGYEWGQEDPDDLVILVKV